MDGLVDRDSILTSLSVFEAYIQLFYLHYFHGFIAKGLLSLLYSLHLCITEFLEKVYAVTLHDALWHAAKDNNLKNVCNMPAL